MSPFTSEGCLQYVTNCKHGNVKYVIEEEKTIRQTEEEAKHITRAERNSYKCQIKERRLKPVWIYK